MKIYLVGSSSVGKSTLARYISKKYKLELLPECARLILAERELQIDSLRSDLDVVNSYQEDIFSRQLEMEKNKDSFVSDRSFDCLAYAAQYSQISQKIIESKEYKEYIQKLKDKDIFIFFVRSFKETLKQDGVRETLYWDNVLQIDGMVKFILETSGLRYFMISCSNMQERAKQIDAILSLAK